MKRNVAASAPSPKRRSSRNMKSTRQPKPQPQTAAREPPPKARSVAEPSVGSSSSGGLQWPPVEVPRRLRSRTVHTRLPKGGSVKPHAVLGVNVPTGPRGSTAPFPPSRVAFAHLSGVFQALGIGAHDAVGTPVGTPMQSFDSLAFAAAVDSMPSASATQGSQVSDGAEASAPLLLQQQKNGKKLHPVLGIFVPTGSRGSRCPCPCSRVPELLSLFPGGN